MQHCWPTTPNIVGSKMLHIASVCTPCCMLLGVVAQSLKPPVKLLTPCKGTQHCWELLRPFSGTIVALIVRIGSFTVRTIVKVNSQLLIRSRVSWNKSQLSSLIIFLALQTLKKKNKKRFSERENKAWPFFLIFRWHKSWTWKWWPNSFFITSKKLWKVWTQESFHK